MSPLLKFVNLLTSNKDTISVVLSIFAFCLSISTFYRGWQKDRRDAAIALQARRPRITIKTEQATRDNVYLSGSRQFINGWNFGIEIEIENRFGFSCIIKKICGSDPGGALVSLHSPVGDGLKPHESDPICLRGDYQPTKDGGVVRTSFGLHLVKEIDADLIRRGVEIDLNLEFEVQKQNLVMEKVLHRVVLRPARVVER